MDKKKKKISIIDFVAEQNRLIRTRGLPKDHPEGALEPMDVPLSAEEAEFFDDEDEWLL